MQSTNQTYASSAAEYANAEAGPSNYASPPASAGRLQALAPVRASGEDDSSGVVILPTEPNVFTDKQLEEYKEQDRYLPVRYDPSASKLTNMIAQRMTCRAASILDRKRWQDHEKFPSRLSKDSKGS
jgi:hypothetical protein